MTNQDRWIFLAGAKGARLVRFERLPTGAWRADDEICMHNPWFRDHDRERPQALNRGRGVDPGGYSFGDRGHTEEEAQRRFARDAAQWLAAAMDERRVQEIDVFAATRLLSDLHEAWPGRLRKHVHEHDLDLTPLRTSDLVPHPAIERLLAAS